MSSTDRPHAIVTAFINTFAGRSVREADPLPAFQQLARQLPNLDAGELAEAADLAKALSSELRSLGHRVLRAEDHERRRRAAGR